MKEEGNLVQLWQLRCRLLTPCYFILSVTVIDFGYIDFISTCKKLNNAYPQNIRK
jgi:hypothetical protein